MGLRLLAPKSSAVRLLGHDSNIGGGEGGTVWLSTTPRPRALASPPTSCRAWGINPS